MCSRQRTCQKKRSTWQTVWNTNFTWKGSSQFPEFSQLFWHGMCSALEYGQEIARNIWKNKTCSKPLTRFNTNPSNTLFLYHSKPSGNIPGAFSGAGKTRIQRPFQAVPRDKTIQWWANLEWRVNQMYMNIQSICFEYISKECESIFSDLLILWVASPNGRLSNGNIPNHFQQIQDLELTCIWNVS